MWCKTVVVLCVVWERSRWRCSCLRRPCTGPAGRFRSVESLTEGVTERSSTIKIAASWTARDFFYQNPEFRVFDALQYSAVTQATSKATRQPQEQQRQPLPTWAGSPVLTYDPTWSLVATLIPKAVREGAQDPHLKRQASGSMKMLMT